MNDVAKEINFYKENPDELDRALGGYGRYLYEFDPENLKVESLQSGFPTLDAYMFLKRGRGELIIVGARPSMGKSAFIFQMAFQVARQLPVHIFSLEMDHDSIVTRLIAQMLGKPIDAIQQGLVQTNDILEAKDKLEQYKCIIDDRSGLTVEQVCDAARIKHRNEGTQLIVVDYLQLLRVEKGHSKDDEVGNISRTLKGLAKELKVPVLVASQLNRQNELRGGDRKPMLSDLRDSGALEQDADVVALIHRESRYTGNRIGEADLIIAKNRNGRTGDIVFNYHAAQTKFEDKEEI